MCTASNKKTPSVVEYLFILFLFCQCLGTDIFFQLEKKLKQKGACGCVTSAEICLAKSNMAVVSHVITTVDDGFFLHLNGKHLGLVEYILVRNCHVMFLCRYDTRWNR